MWQSRRERLSVRAYITLSEIPSPVPMFSLTETEVEVYLRRKTSPRPRHPAPSPLKRSLPEQKSWGKG